TIAWVAVVLDNVPCFSQASTVVDALHGREMAADDTLRCLHHPLQGLAIGSGAATIPGSDAAREDALNGASIKVFQSFRRHATLLESPQEVNPLLCIFARRVRLHGPGEVILDVHTEEFEVGDSLHCSSLNVYGVVTPPLSLPEIHNHILSLADVEREVIILTP